MIQQEMLFKLTFVKIKKRKIKKEKNRRILEKAIVYKTDIKI